MIKLFDEIRVTFKGFALDENSEKNDIPEINR